MKSKWAATEYEYAISCAKEGNGYNSGHLSSACFFVDEQKDMQKMKRECIWR